ATRQRRVPSSTDGPRSRTDFDPAPLAHSEVAIRVERCETHPRSMRLRVPALFLLLLGASALGSPRTDIETLRWLAGEWQGDGPTGHIDAYWLPPTGGTMAGVARRIREGRVLGYAIVNLAEPDGPLVLPINRFDPN